MAAKRKKSDSGIENTFAYGLIIVAAVLIKFWYISIALVIVAIVIFVSRAKKKEAQNAARAAEASRTYNRAPPVIRGRSPAR